MTHTQFAGMAIWAHSLLKRIEKSKDDLDTLFFIPDLKKTTFVLEAFTKYDKLHNNLDDYITKNRFEGWKKEVQEFWLEDDVKNMDAKLANSILI